MTQQLTIPPPHVWDKIEKILDDQAFGRKQTDQLIADTFRPSGNIRRKKKYFITSVTTISLLIFFMLKYSEQSKNN